MQLFGSAAAWQHSPHAGGERANAGGNEHLCGAGGSVPEALSPGACSVPEGLRGRAGGHGEEWASQALRLPATALGPTLNALIAPLLCCGRETLLSPSSIESGASSSSLSDMAHDHSECWELPKRLSSQHSPSAPRCGTPPPPSAALRKLHPSSALSSPPRSH